MLYNNQLSRSNPEAQGVSSSGILAFIEAVENNKLELHSFMLLRHGYVVSEGWWSPYSSEDPHMLFSLSKSFTSTAIGLAAQEKRLTVDDLVLSFFPEEAPEEVSDNLSRLRIKHLLSMSTGHAKDTTEYVTNQKHGNWVKAFLELPIDFEPGTHFVYNTAATYMLSAIVQKVTGETLLEYLTSRLFKPLGIEGAAWETCPRGINTGGFGLSVKTEDLAKFGQLYLQKGVWDGKPILTEEWIKEATASHISNGTDENNDWAQGYGYQFWKCRHDAYRGDGAFGQFCVVIPEQDAVIAITSGLDDMQAVLNLVWKHLLTSMQLSALAEEDSQKKALQEKLANLKLYPPKLQQEYKTSKMVSRKLYKIDNNELGVQSMSFIFNDDSCALKIWDVRGEHEINCGIEYWVKGTTVLFGNKSAVVSSGTWCDENTFMMTCRLIETPFCYTIKYHFNYEAILIELTTNVSFGPKELTSLKGKMI
jgi:CubicO group peptidase (beta-lactamase class C family)